MYSARKKVCIELLLLEEEPHVTAWRKMAIPDGFLP
jgi:hypothetical protein